MSRDALVVGINQYYSLKPLNTQAADAEAIAQYLEKYGNFQVIHRLPRLINEKLKFIINRMISHIPHICVISIIKKLY